MNEQLRIEFAFSALGFLLDLEVVEKEGKTKKAEKSPLVKPAVLLPDNLPLFLPRYGANVTVTCVPNVECEGDSEKTIEINMTCQYCFQTNFGPEHVCTLRNGPDSNCHVKKSPTSQSRFKTNCTVKPHVHCLGRRTFHKMLPCNWTSGYRWTTSLLLSIFLGGFGADRFYLGQWREGIGKLFSFGGLGVWTVIDVILISIGYIGPQDGSLYIY